MDKYFRLETLTATVNPQLLCWLAAHQDYSHTAVAESLDKSPSETKAGEYIIKHCLKFKHFGILEHPSITLNVIGFPHDTLMQLRTHRVGISFDIQSQRYTSKGVVDVCDGERDVEKVFYFEPVGLYTDRKGNSYEYTEEQRERDKSLTVCACNDYTHNLRKGAPEERLRRQLPQRIRQHAVVSLNARSLCHLLDVRSTADVQQECRYFAELLFLRFKEWMPEVADFYESTRLKKNQLAP